MRLATWNCRQGLTERKLAALDGLGADVMVVQELQPSFVPTTGWTVLRRDPQAPRALGVLTRPGWSTQVHPADPGLPWLLPVTVHGPDGEELTLLAVWTVAGPGLPTYVRQCQQVISAWDEVGEWSRTVLAGDLNASMQSDRRPEQHARTVGMLAERGLASAYHSATGTPHGDEDVHTLRWVGRGKVVAWFHCDLVFAPAALLTGRASVGAAEQWCCPGMSDHAPVVADLADSAPGRAPSGGPPRRVQVND